MSHHLSDSLRMSLQEVSQKEGAVKVLACLHRDSPICCHRDMFPRETRNARLWNKTKEEE